MEEQYMMNTNLMITHYVNMREKVKKSEHLQDLIRNQISIFPSSKQFDYTDLISRESTSMEIDGYFDQELFNLIDLATQSKTFTKHGSSPAYNHLRKARIQMIIGVLCLTMNPSCCFLQTLNGLLCYA